MFQLLHRFNPTASLLRMKTFIARHDYIFSLLLLLNVNMGAFDISLKQKMQQQQRAMRAASGSDADAGADDAAEGSDSEDDESAYLAYAMLQEVRKTAVEFVVFYLLFLTNYDPCGLLHVCM